MVVVVVVVVLSLLCSSAGAALDGDSGFNVAPVSEGRNNAKRRNKRSTVSANNVWKCGAWHESFKSVKSRYAIDIGLRTLPVTYQRTSWLSTTV